MRDIKRILVVKGWTRDCKKALRYGISLARRYDAELSILHIIRDTLAAFYTYLTCRSHFIR